MENFIGKKVLVTVAFAIGAVNAGSIPQEFMGVLEKSNGEFLEFSDVKTKKVGFTSSSYVDYGNSAIINKNYIVMMVEI
ncbi:MAG: hypothetical protein IKE01_04790 [Clostridia bacterium]|nr:hypothetical protein [Clostridia bacterium]